MAKVADKPTEQPNEAKAPAKAPEVKETLKGAPDLAVVKAWGATAKEQSRATKWEYFVVDQFIKGNHSITGNPNTNEIEVVKRSTRVNFPINQIEPTLRAVLGFVTRHRPVATIEPENSSEDAKTYTRRANKVIERDNQLNNSRKINKEWVWYGLARGMGIRQIGYDPKKKTSIRWNVDPWDLDWLGSTELEDSPAVIKHMTRTIGYLKQKFPETGKDLAPDGELAGDEFKALSMQLASDGDTASENLEIDAQTVLVHECWYRTPGGKENAQGGTVNKCTYTENTMLDYQQTPYTEYPFITYKPKTDPSNKRGESHLKQSISPQRLLNLLNEQLTEYNHIVNRGRFQTEKNSGFSSVTSKEGQLIRVNPGKSLLALNPPAINPMLERQINMAIDYIKDIGSQQDASRGKMPSAGASGALVEALQAGDANSISDFRDNYEDALALEASWILKMYSLFEQDGIKLSNKISDEEEETYGVVGAEALTKTGKALPKYQDKERFYSEDDGEYYDVCAILPDNQVKVSVTSQLGETKAARIELMMRLVELGMPFKALLEHLEFPNTSDIFERMTEEALGQIALDQMQASATQPAIPPEGAPMPPGDAGAPQGVPMPPPEPAA